MIRKLRALVVFPFLAAGLGHAQEAAPRALPPPILQDAAALTADVQTVVFSGGCFWGVQGVFSHVRGVKRAVSGYTGGAAATANYEAVSTGKTGHAEAVAVTYDPRQVSYSQLMRIFFSVALDPTQSGRQGPDEGSQYRSVLWTTTPGEARQAKAYIQQLSAAHAYAAPITTRVESLHGFWPAERYHQNFMALHPENPYIQAWDTARIAALKALYPNAYRAEAVRML